MREWNRGMSEWNLVYHDEHNTRVVLALRKTLREMYGSETNLSRVEYTVVVNDKKKQLIVTFR